MTKMKSKVNPLNWKVPIVNPDGTPTDEFMRKWLQQATQNTSVTDLSTAANVSAVLDLISAAKGSILIRGAFQWLGLAGPAGHDGWLATWNDTTGLPEWRAPAGASGGAPSSFWLDGTHGYVALVDSNAQLVLDSHGDGVYSTDPVLPATMLPTPGASTLGGVKSLAAVAHNFLTSITAAGQPVAAQPATTDLSDVSAGTWTPTDASGGGLSLTVTAATFTKIGSVYFITANITYPSTVDTNGTAITGYPGSAGISASFTNSNATHGSYAFFRGSGAIGLADATINSSYTNAQVSGKNFIFLLITGV